ncbi:mandelate racemase [Thalassospira mesophila]|uniref:Mandelate racemase n=1 Tax=Thalassospira mesophila TaxID=1293891 RepID=A0A1Y2KXU3_9PROT|nr:mandelate racemase [Thalassospira mesophila]OSQ36794.1 mandelate racemase [Thalassospira mesophila]
MDISPIHIVDISAFERTTPFRFPFRFGVAKVTQAPQLFVRAVIEDGQGRTATGQAAEMMMPKWFDKSANLSTDDNINQLRLSVKLAMQAMIAAGQSSPFGLHARVEAAHHETCASHQLPGLVASYGLALVDRAIIDGFCRLHGLTIARAIQTNALGISTDTAPDLHGFDLTGFLASLAPQPTIAIRHTVGLGDVLWNRDLTDAERLNDGQPQTLEDVIAAYGHTFFKLKVSGEVGADLNRLVAIAGVLDQKVGQYQLTIDGNEQFENADQVAGLIDRIMTEPRLKNLWQSTLFLEQPIARANALMRPLGDPGARVPFEIDESDDSMGAFLAAKDMGYRGISSKSCKGFYRALLNCARVAHWNAKAGANRFFMSAEDLTTQSGLALQQDLVLASLTGARHIERNGHHYVAGMAGAPQAEQNAYLAQHGDLYHANAAGQARLNIQNGQVSLATVAAATGLGCAVTPDWSEMTPLAD